MADDTEQDDPPAPAPKKKDVFKADPKRHVFLEGQDYVEMPDDAKAKSRRIVYAGQNFEHVSETPEGIWVYRAM